MHSTEIHSNGHTPAKTDADLNEAVPPAMRVAEDTRATDQHSKQSVTEEFSTPGTRATAAKSKRINPDSGLFIRVVMGGVMVAGLVAFAISFVSLYQVAEWLGLPPWMWWAVPTFIDLAILVYAGLVLVHQARGERTWPSWLALGAFTLLSVIANSAHALSHGHDAAWQAYVAVLIAAMVPVAIFVATEQLSRVAIEDLNSRKSEIQEQVELEVFEAEQQQRRDEIAFEREQQQREREQQRLRAQWNTEVEQTRHEQALASLQAEPQTVNSEQQKQPAASTQQSSVVTAKQPVKKPSNDDDLLAFVQEQVAEGVEVTGAMVAEFLDVSARTGRRRIKDLQESHPELFAPDDRNDVEQTAHTVVVDDE